MKAQYAILGLFFLALMTIQSVVAVDFNQTISAQDKATFDHILEPVMKVYNLVKYIASVIAVVILLFAGITYMTSGSDPGKREKAKKNKPRIAYCAFILTSLQVLFFPFCSSSIQ